MTIDRPREEDLYNAHNIEVLEGLEPVRLRPGMYIGGVDSNALHHLVAELVDNSMDEAVAGHASRIELELSEDGFVHVRDNGRGIPVDHHPKFPDKSALEVILTTLHSGGKFDNNSYETAGGLHGVGISVVNALSELLIVEVVRNRSIYVQKYKKGVPVTKLEEQGKAQNRRGTSVSFLPDREIFANNVHFDPARLRSMARSKAYLFKGVEIRWKCSEKAAVKAGIEPQENFHFPHGIADFLQQLCNSRPLIMDEVFAGEADFSAGEGRFEWALAWPEDQEGYTRSYCNTVPTPLGGTHESGFKTGLLRAIKNHGERAALKKAAQITAEDILGGSVLILSVFYRSPQFQGQTKEKLVSQEVVRFVENAIRDRFELWLGKLGSKAGELLDYVTERCEERLLRKKQKDVKRQSATQKLRLPGKLADCSADTRKGTELFIVEGDSAGGSAKQARFREWQAILPLRGKILNVAASSKDKISQNKELQDLVTALGCGMGRHCEPDQLRYDKVIIMTDADVDGAHIATLLITFFFQKMRPLIENGHLFLAQPPLYKLAHASKTVYAQDDASREELMKSAFPKKAQVEVSRFKGLGEMNPAQLRETTMNPASRKLLQFEISDLEGKSSEELIEDLMGKKPERRFAFIQDHAYQAGQLDV